MTDSPFASLHLVEIYDGTGRHLGGVHPPLAVDNVLTQAYHDSKAARPVGQALYLYPEDANVDLALVWMLPLGMTRETPIPHEIAGEIVQAVDARKTVIMHGNDPEIVARIRALIASFVGGGHA
jgi:hypothetical protein